jgi:UDP-N-acetylglucosamine--N-acetylmuramyl-(pentapeptide) pyrophosphoryl-undecaprenol N-acetylglucosamine transferase
LPVVIAAGKTPVVTHESDITPGLANRISGRFADYICVSFEDTLKGLPQAKAVFTGAPIRAELYKGDKTRALKMTGFSGNKPVLLVIGGSLGAKRPNELVRAALPQLLPRYDIVHLCGKGKLQENLSAEGYVQYEYIEEELPDLFSFADIVLSRAGANAVFELLALKKPALLIPLSKSSTRGDQIRHAAYFEKKGYALTLHQEGATAESLVLLLDQVYGRREAFIHAMERDACADGTESILAIIRQAARA